MIHVPYHGTRPHLTHEASPPFAWEKGDSVFARLRRLIPDQDDVRARHRPGTALNGAKGGGGSVEASASVAILLPSGQGLTSTVLF